MKQQPSFYKQIALIAAPIALSQLMSSLLSTIDSWMVLTVSESALTGVGIIASFTFLLTMILWGLLSGLGIFIAQFHGAKQVHNIHKVIVISMISALSVASLFFLVLYFAPNFVIGLYNHIDDPIEYNAVLNYAKQYSRIQAFSFFMLAISFTLSMIMRSVKHVFWPNMVNITIVILNTILNYLLIGGHFGFPALGVEGAATATIISSFIGMVILIIYFISLKAETFRFKPHILKEVKKDFVKHLVLKAGPVAINEAMWGLGMSAYIMAIGYIGASAMNVVLLSNQVMGILWVFTSGIGNAAAIMLGSTLGENKLEQAKEWAHQFVRLNFMIGIALGTLLFFARGSIVDLFFNLSEETATSFKLLLMIYAFYAPIKFTNALHIIGTLRSGGDTVYTMLAEVGALWLYGVPMAFALSIFTDLNVVWVLTIVNIEEIIKFTLVSRRFYSYKWVNNLTTI